MSENIKSKSSPVKSEEQQFAQMVLDTFNASGLAVKQFCKNEGIPEWKFYQYKRSLRQRTIGDKNATTFDQNKSKPRFAQIAHLSSNSSAIQIEFPSGINIHISNGCDKHLLRETINIFQC